MLPSGASQTKQIDEVSPKNLPLGGAKGIVLRYRSNAFSPASHSKPINKTSHEESISSTDFSMLGIASTVDRKRVTSGSVTTIHLAVSIKTEVGCKNYIVNETNSDARQNTEGLILQTSILARDTHLYSPAHCSLWSTDSTARSNRIPIREASTRTRTWI